LHVKQTESVLTLGDFIFRQLYKKQKDLSSTNFKSTKQRQNMTRDDVYSFYKDEDIRDQLEEELDIDGVVNRWSTGFDEQIAIEGADIKIGNLKTLFYIKAIQADDIDSGIPEMHLTKVYIMVRNKTMKEVQDTALNI